MVNIEDSKLDGLKITQVFENGYLKYIIENKNKNTPQMIVVHDSENSSAEAGLQYVMRYGGTLHLVENKEKRNIGGRDPNSVFKSSGKLKSFLIKGVNMILPILTLHNNGEGHSKGNYKTISIDNVGQGKEVIKRDDQDKDDLLWVVTDNQSYIDLLKGLNYNLVIEKVTKEKDDGSLSNYAGLNGCPLYINFEFEEGHLVEQFNALTDIIERFKL